MPLRPAKKELHLRKEIWNWARLKTALTNSQLSYLVSTKLLAASDFPLDSAFWASLNSNSWRSANCSALSLGPAQTLLLHCSPDPEIFFGVWTGLETSFSDFRMNYSVFTMSEWEVLQIRVRWLGLLSLPHISCITVGSYWFFLS